MFICGLKSLFVGLVDIQTFVEISYQLTRYPLSLLFLFLSPSLCHQFTLSLLHLLRYFWRTKGARREREKKRGRARERAEKV